MTYQDAYTEGFCKTAEAYGVDPRELVKVAGAAGLLGKLSKSPLWGGVKALYNLKAGPAALGLAGIYGGTTFLKDLYNKAMGKNVNINTHNITTP